MTESNGNKPFTLSIYEKQAQTNLREGGRKGGLANSSKHSQNSSKASNIDNDNKIDVRAKLAKTAGVSTDTYDTKEEVMRWMLDIQLGRRNLSPIQRIAVAEKYRPLYEKEAKENQSKAGKEYGNGGTKLTANLPQALDKEKKERNPTTDKKLADIADVSEKTYRMGAKILNSDNEDLKKRVQSGETSISAGYKELTQGKSKEKGKENKNKEENNMSSSTDNKPTTPKTQISEETKQICADLKIEKTKEYLALDYCFIRNLSKD